MRFERNTPISEDRKKYTENDEKISKIKGLNIEEIDTEQFEGLKMESGSLKQENWELLGKAQEEAGEENELRDKMEKKHLERANFNNHEAAIEKATKFRWLKNIAGTVAGSSAIGAVGFWASQVAMNGFESEPAASGILWGTAVAAALYMRWNTWRGEKKIDAKREKDLEELRKRKAEVFGN